MMETMDDISAPFPLGQMLATISVLEVCKFGAIDLGPYIERHLAGDWGDVSTDIRSSNDRAMKEGKGVLKSVFHPGGRRIWLVTDSARSQTVAMLPHELEP